MNPVSAAPPQGESALVAVDRALSELRRGRAIVVRERAGQSQVPLRWRLFAPLETAEPALITFFREQPGCSLAVTRERALALQVAGSAADVVELTLPRSLTTEQVQKLGHEWEAEGWCAVLRGVAAQAGDQFAAAAVQLAKSAQLLPAVMAAPLSDEALPANVQVVGLDEVKRYAQPIDEDLLRVSEADVPLRNDAGSRLVLFRDRRDATEHVAVVVGEPDVSQPVKVRVHSSCFTGDLLGSLRCDCGEQLQTAIQRLHDAGSGVLLYLAQEGRGIGLANKLRAYQLQDDGLDTVDADRHLGFSADERSYAIAAAILRSLGISRVLLLTNSPHKVQELRARGIDVVAMEKLPGTPNQHNERYLRTKRERTGHL
jgi:GTP cyclohydrolase II